MNIYLKDKILQKTYQTYVFPCAYCGQTSPIVIKQPRFRKKKKIKCPVCNRKTIFLFLDEDSLDFLQAQYPFILGDYTYDEINDMMHDLKDTIHDINEANKP